MLEYDKDLEADVTVRNAERSSDKQHRPPWLTAVVRLLQLLWRTESKRDLGQSAR